MHSRTRAASAALALLIAVAAVFALAGCGSSGSSSSPTPTTAASATAGGLAAVKDYLNQVSPILAQVGTTVAALPSDVQGLSKKPDATWTAAATKLDTAAADLGTQATSLSALSAPTRLQGVQDVVVKAIQSAQTAVTKLASGLQKATAKTAAAQANVKAQLLVLQTQLTAVVAQLTQAVQSLVLSPSATPTP